MVRHADTRWNMTCIWKEEKKKEEEDEAERRSVPRVCLPTLPAKKNRVRERLHVDALPLPQTPLRWAVTVSKATCRERGEQESDRERERRISWEKEKAEIKK